MEGIFYIVLYLIIGISVAKGTEFVHKQKLCAAVIAFWPFFMICIVLCLLIAPGSTITDIKNYYFNKEKIEPIEEIKKEIIERVVSRFEIMDLD